MDNQNKVIKEPRFPNQAKRKYGKAYRKSVLSAIKHGNQSKQALALTEKANEAYQAYRKALKIYHKKMLEWNKLPINKRLNWSETYQRHLTWGGQAA